MILELTTFPLRRKATLKLLIVLSLAGLLSACSSVAYYSQSIIGHSRLMLARQSIDEVLKTADPELADQLRLVQNLRQFAVSELGLPNNRSYTSYVALKRDYPVWTVVAAAEFSLEAKSWCYPVIGCASYRGFFVEEDAEQYAASLSDKGLETSVGGATAYSTLGWFSDPILPSMLGNGEAQLAEVLFHELAHQRLYIKGDSAFNEAFATVVGEQGALLWLQANAEQKVLDSYLSQRHAIADFDQLLNATKSKLAALYDSDLPVNQKQLNKKELVLELQQNYQELKETRWQGRKWFQHWFSKPVNNARLASISTYREKLPELEQLLLACDKNFTRFYRSLERLTGRDKIVVPQRCSKE